MNKPTVTICVITCNQRPFIEECLRSVLEQEVDAEFRVLVGDDASDDGTSDIVARMTAENPGKMTHFLRDRRLGAMSNMRDLMARADGDFVARVDGDDYWLPGKLQRQLDYLHASPDCIAVYTNAIAVDESGRSNGLFNDVGDVKFDLAAMLRRGNFLNNSSMLLRSAGRHAWLDVDVPQIDYRVHLWHARQALLGHVGQPLVAYRVNTRGSLVRSMNAQVRELYWQAIQSVPRELVSDADYARAVTDLLRRVFFRSLRTREPGLLRTWAARIYVASPYGRWRTTALAATNIMRMMGKMVAGWLGAPKYRRVLYRR